MKLSSILTVWVGVASALVLEQRGNCRDNCGRQIAGTRPGGPDVATRSADCTNALTTTPAYASACTKPGSYASACSCLLGDSTTTSTSTVAVTVTTASMSATGTSSSVVSCTATHPILAGPTVVAPGFGGTLPTSNDSGFFKISLPFPIKIYGVSSTDVYMAVNGVLYLQNPSGPPVVASSSIWDNKTSTIVGYGNKPLPTGPCSSCSPCASALPYYAVAALWDDLLVAANTTQGLWYEIVQLQTPEMQRSVIFEWYTTHHDDRSLVYHFTVQFFEHHPDWITITYYQIGLDGAGATVGVQGGPDDAFAQYSYNSSVITAGLVLDYNPSTNAWQVSHKDDC